MSRFGSAHRACRVRSRISRWGYSALWLLTAYGPGVGCSPSRPAATLPIPAPTVPQVETEVNPWPATLLSAQHAAAEGRHGEAERMLADFAAAHPDTPEAADATFYRALLKADPDNARAAITEAIPLIDSYLAGGPDLPRHLDALVLRRLIESLDSTRTLVATVRTSQEARSRVRDAELQKLSDELEKTVAELERIKRRLAGKPPQ